MLIVLRRAFGCVCVLFRVCFLLFFVFVSCYPELVEDSGSKSEEECSYEWFVGG